MTVVHRRLAALAVLLLGCSFAGCLPTCSLPSSPHFVMSSGDLKNDDVEEPIPEMGKRFAPLLTRSNELVGMLQDGRTRDFYEQAFDDALKQKVTLADFENLYAGILSKAGPAQGFKEQQWKFREQGGRVSSSKIVRHRDFTVYYTFTFASPTATRLVGVHFQPRAPVTPPPSAAK